MPAMPEQLLLPEGRAFLAALLKSSATLTFSSGMGRAELELVVRCKLPHHLQRMDTDEWSSSDEDSSLEPSTSQCTPPGDGWNPDFPRGRLEAVLQLLRRGAKRARTSGAGSAGRGSQSSPEALQVCDREDSVGSVGAGSMGGAAHQLGGLSPAPGGGRGSKASAALLEHALTELSRLSEMLLRKEDECENLRMVMKQLSETRGDAIKLKIQVLENYNALQEEYAKVVKVAQLAKQVSARHFGLSGKLRRDLRDTQADLRQWRSRALDLQDRNQGLRSENSRLRRELEVLEREHMRATATVVAIGHSGSCAFAPGAVWQGGNTP